MEHTYNVDLEIPLSGEAHTLVSAIIPQNVEIVRISIQGSDLPYASFVRMLVTVEGEIVYMGSLRRKTTSIDIDDKQVVGTHRILMVMASLDSSTPDVVRETLGEWEGTINMEVFGNHKEPTATTVGIAASDSDKMTKFTNEFTEKWA